MNLGQVYTKEIVADYMVSLLSLPKNSFIVDPCMGMGVFIRSLIKKNFNNITGIEIDSNTYNSIDSVLFSECNLLNKDFFSFTPSKNVDGFILNPPYVRQEEIDDMNILGLNKDYISDKCGDFSIYSKANLYLYFIARCISLLKEGGEMIAIYPNSWLNTPDGNNFYSQILKHGSVDLLIQVEGYPFVGNPLVDVMIMKFTKGGNTNTIKKSLVVSNNELFIRDCFDSVSFEGFDCIPLSNVASIRRGLTTGYNRVFINPDINDETFKDSILSSPKDIPGYTTINARLDKLLRINCTKNIPCEIEKYLNKCACQIVANKKPKSLVELINKNKCWYILPIPQTSDIIFPYIIRENVRFVLNESRVIVRDNFYSISSNISPKLLMALLNNLFIFSQLELHGKSYGNGLLKIQKYDVDNLVIPNPSKLDIISQEKLIKCSENLIKTSDYKYVLEATDILKSFYKVDNIETIYNSQKNNRLKYEL